MRKDLLFLPRCYKQGPSYNDNVCFYFFPQTASMLFTHEPLPMMLLWSIGNSLVSCISGPNWHNRLSNILKGNTVPKQREKKDGNPIPHVVTLQDLVPVYKLYLYEVNAVIGFTNQKMHLFKLGLKKQINIYVTAEFKQHA